MRFAQGVCNSNAYIGLEVLLFVRSFLSLSLHIVFVCTVKVVARQRRCAGYPHMIALAFCLRLDRFYFGLRLIQAPNKPAGYHSGSGTCRAKTLSYLDIPFFFRPGHLVPSFIMGFNSLMLFFYVSKFTFLNRLLDKKITFDQMHIGKFYHISCNTMLCRLFNSVNPLCLYICMCIYEYYYYYNIVEAY